MGIKILALRHRTAPLPESCRWCGHSQREHGQRHTAAKKWHTYKRPTPEQVTARMRARRNLNQAFVMPDSTPIANTNRTRA